MVMLKQIGSAAYYALRYFVSGVPAPVFLSYSVTYRCTNNCVYCDLPDPDNELDFETVKPILFALKKMGLTRLGLTGGEPLLHPDIGRIIDYCKSMGIMTVMSTNGLLVEKRIDEISNLDLASVSVDCIPSAHDKQRGQGGYAKAIQAVKLLQNRHIDVVLSPVLTAETVPHVDQFLEMARQLGVMVVIQPYFKCGETVDPNDSLIPERESFRDAIEIVIREKRRSRGLVASTMPYLRFIQSNYPSWDPKGCLAGKLFFGLSPDGRLAPCYPLTGDTASIQVTDENIARRINEMKGTKCKTCCYCNGHLENNNLFRFHPLSVLDVIGNLGIYKGRKKPCTPGVE